MKINRFITGAGLVGLVTAGVLTNSPPTTRQANFGQARLDQLPSMPPANVMATEWFCPGAQTNPDGTVTATVVVANPNATAARGVLHVVPIDGAPVTQPIVIDPTSRASINIGALVNAGWVAATIEVSGATVSAEIVTSSRLGTDAAACASRASTSWYFATGQTISTETVKATEVVTLYNPYNEDAAVDVTYVTDEGPINPIRLKGFVVPAGSVRIVNVGETAIRKKAIATTVVTRVGRVIAGRWQGYDGTARVGSTFAVGATAPALEWYFPYGRKTAGATFNAVIYNPGDNVAAVDLEITIDGGQAEPVQLTIPGRSILSTDFATIAQIPNNVPFSLIARSTNDVPVIAERVVDFAAASGSLGTSTMLGAPTAHARWILTAGGVNATQAESVIVFNPGVNAVEVNLNAFGTVTGPVGKQQPITIKGGGRVVINVGDSLSGDVIPIVVSASGAVVVERGIVAAPTKASGGTTQPGTGTSYQLAIPFP